jgi:hypothetical protein
MISPDIVSTRASRDRAFANLHRSRPTPVVRMPDPTMRPARTKGELLASLPDMRTQYAESLISNEPISPQWTAFVASVWWITAPFLAAFVLLALALLL